MLAQRWLWYGGSAASRAARLASYPASLMFRTAVSLHATAYRRGFLPVRRLALPAISVGNLSVGGTGKTPISNWMARTLQARGHRPAIVLRGHGNDEAALHRKLAGPGIVVVEDPNRRRGVQRARNLSCDVAILDDAFQRLEIKPNLNVVLIGAESMNRRRLLLPAGPWREDLRTLARADILVVTRKTAELDQAAALAQRLGASAQIPFAVAHLSVHCFHGLRARVRVEGAELRGCRVLAVAGIAHPDLFHAQLEMLGMSVAPLWRADHHRFSDREIGRIVQMGKEVDYVVVTEKDAVKLRNRWPAAVPEPLVAVLDVAWDVGQEMFLAALSERSRESPELMLG
ncbi:MAG: tetraacyldisaccharide 4'-kinase [Gemmatimonadetes bacterium]|nr:tetraacyldisaccharide 4'-kinase [Gemmatimonadota bacterium]